MTLKRALLLLIAALSAFGQGQNTVVTGTMDASALRWVAPSGAYSARPSGASTNMVYIVTDDSAAGACAGGGTATSICKYNGTTWVAIGGSSSFTIPGLQNAFGGSGAGASLTTGSANVGIGYQALNAVTSGTVNVGVGSQALRLTTGSWNTGIGPHAMYNATTASDNSCFGGDCLYNLTTGTGNVSVGEDALFGVTTSDYSVGIGLAAGAFLADGSTLNSTPTRGIWIGRSSLASGAGTTDEIVIGALATGSGSHTTTIGHTTNTDTYMRGILHPDSISTAGSVSTGVGGSVGGYLGMGAGTATAATTGQVGWMAPTSVTTPYFMRPPGAPTTGFFLNTGTTDPTTVTFVPSNGSGNVLLSSGTAAIASGKTATVSNSLTFAGTDSTVMTFPSTSATIARTDAANTFTGTQTVGALVATTVNGNTFTTGTGTLTIGAGKTLTASNSVTLAGTDSTTMTFPTTSSTIFGSGTKADVTQSAQFCADAGANDTYACNLSPAITAYVTGTHYRFKANTANTGAASINFNSVGALTIVKLQGAITTTLANNDIRVGQWVECVYDGTNCQMMSALGNAAAGSGTIASTTQVLVGDGAGNATGAGSSSTLYLHPDGTTGTGGSGFPPNGATTMAVTDDCLSGLQGISSVNIYCQLGWAAALGGAAPIAAETNHPGILRVSTGASSGTTKYIALGSGQSGSNDVVLNTADTFDVKMLIRTGTVANQDICFGTTINLAHTCVDADIFNAMKIRILASDGTHHFFMCSDKAGTLACHDSGITAADNTWYYLRIRRISSTSVGFTVGTGWGLGTEYTATASASVPAGSASNIQLQIKNSTAANNTVDFDYFEFTSTISR